MCSILEELSILPMQRQAHLEREMTKERVSATQPRGKSGHNEAALWNDGHKTEAAGHAATAKMVSLLRMHLQNDLNDNKKDFVLQQCVMKLAAGNSYLASELPASPN